MKQRLILSLTCCTLIMVLGEQNVWAGNLGQANAGPGLQENSKAVVDVNSARCDLDHSALTDSVAGQVNNTDELSPTPGHDNAVNAFPGGNNQADAARLPVKYWGNSFSCKFHRPSCPFAQAMSLRHVIFFNFRWQAVERGQSPCRYCLPPFWTCVRSKILPPTATTEKSSD